MREALRGQGLPCELELTRRPGHATEIARAAVEEGTGLVVAAGGDGTVNEVAQALVGTDAVLGVLPLGSGNDFAAALGVPEELTAAVARLARNDPAAVDAGRVNGRVFVNFVGIGIDGQIADDYRRFRFLKGKPGYFAAALLELLRFRAFRVEIQVDDWQFTGEMLLTVVMNGRRGGGGFLLSPRAKLDDGKLDLVAISDCPRFKRFGVLPKVRDGSHLELDLTQFRQGRRLVISTDRPLIVQLDGEVLPRPANRIEAEVLPGALRVA